MQLPCEVELIQTFEDGSQVEGRDLESGEAAAYKVKKPAGKFMRLMTGIGDLYFRVEPISKREFEEAKAKDGAKNP